MARNIYDGAKGDYLRQIAEWMGNTADYLENMVSSIYVTIINLLTSIDNYLSSLAGAVNPRGSIDVEIQDQYSEPISLYLGRQIALANLVTDIAVGAYQFQITSTVAPAIGNRICLKNGSAFSQPKITAVTPNGGTLYTITIDSPVDSVFVTTQSCYIINPNLASLAGTQADPQIYQVSPVGLTAGTRFDIIGMTIHIIDSGATAMDDSLFGNGTALANGLLFRKVNGSIKNFANIKRNGDFGDYGFQVEYVVKAPSGSPALRAYLDIRQVFGVAIRLNTDDADSAQIAVQDNIVVTGRDVHVVAHGHVVQD